MKTIVYALLLCSIPQTFSPFTLTNATSSKVCITLFPKQKFDKKYFRKNYKYILDTPKVNIDEMLEHYLKYLDYVTKAYVAFLQHKTPLNAEILKEFTSHYEFIIIPNGTFEIPEKLCSLYLKDTAYPISLKIAKNRETLKRKHSIFFEEEKKSEKQKEDASLVIDIINSSGKYTIKTLENTLIIE